MAPPSGIARASVFEGYQIGLETTKGTQVAAVKRLLSLMIDSDPVTPTAEVEASGAKASVDMISMKDHTQASFKGHLCFNTLNYLLASGLCQPVITVLETGVSQFLYAPVVFGPDTFQTYTVEKGSAAAAESFGYGVVSGLDIDFSTKNCDVKGDMLGQRMANGITMTPTPTDVPISAVSPNQLDVYVASSIAGLTAGKLTDAFMAKWGFKDRHKPKFTLNSLQPSYKETLEAKFNMSAQVVLEEDDTVAAAMMADLYARNKRYCRIVATGALIGATKFETVEITFPFKFKGNKRGDQDGSYAGTFDLVPIYDSTFGSVVKVRVQSTATSLAVLTPPA